jgi:hypothetical protein
VGERLYVINDDGDHVIKLCEVDPSLEDCKMMIIAGQCGQQGNLDHTEGTSALLSRPGRLQTDVLNKKCYFGSRTYKNIRILSLEATFPVSTLDVSFQSVLPEADLDFNRILITPSGGTLLLADRKGPYILMVSFLLSDSPLLMILHTPGSGLRAPLQGACFPIFPLHGDQQWDAKPLPRGRGTTAAAAATAMELFQVPQANERAYLDRALPVSVDHCFVAAGPRIWIVSTDSAVPLPIHLLPPPAASDEPLEAHGGGLDVEDFPSVATPTLQLVASTTSDPPDLGGEEEEDDERKNEKKVPIPVRYRPYYSELCAMSSECSLVCNLSTKFPKFLIHEMLAITSNTLLLLNRHSRRTGVWQLTTIADWRFDKEKEFGKWYEVRYLEGKDYLGPHGMTLSLDRKQLLVVETGLRDENQKGGYVNLMTLHLTTNRQVRVGESHRLRELRGVIEKPAEKIQAASARVREEMETQIGRPYRALYNADGDNYPDRSDEGLEIVDRVRPAVKQIGKCESPLPSSLFLSLSLSVFRGAFG